MKRAEEELTVTNPLKEAFNAFGTDGKGNGLGSSALDGAEDIILNKLPKGPMSSFFISLCYTVSTCP